MQKISLFTKEKRPAKTRFCRPCRTGYPFAKRVLLHEGRCFPGRRGAFPPPLKPPGKGAFGGLCHCPWRWRAGGCPEFFQRGPLCPLRHRGVCGTRMSQSAQSAREARVKPIGGRKRPRPRGCPHRSGKAVTRAPFRGSSERFHKFLRAAGSRPARGGRRPGRGDPSRPPLRPPRPPPPLP